MIKILATVDLIAIFALFGALGAAIAIVGLLLANYRIRKLRARLDSIASVLAAAGDGLESVDQALQTGQVEMGRAQRRISRCWEVLEDVQVALADTGTRAGTKDRVSPGRLAAGEAAMISFANAEH